MNSEKAEDCFVLNVSQGKKTTTIDRMFNKESHIDMPETLSSQKCC